MTVVTLQPVDPARDRDFLLELYEDTRDDVAALDGWTPAQKRAFVTSQFDLQDAHYREHFAGASFDVIEIDGAAAGRMIVDRRDDEIRVVDLALLRAHRGRGVGTRLLRSILDEGRASGRRVAIHVEHGNPALALYRRLGFTVESEGPVHLFMTWRPT